VFYRGGWCPYCNLALRTYQQELLPQLGAFGARLVAISPQSTDESFSFVEKAALEFSVLSDPGSRLADQIGSAFEQADDVLSAQRRLGLDLRKVNAEGAVRLPRPTALVVDQDRNVRFVGEASGFLKTISPRAANSRCMRPVPLYFGGNLTSVAERRCLQVLALLEAGDVARG
jgi:peroxiredoxin